MLGNGVRVGGEPRLSKTEVPRVLSSTGRFQLVKLFEGQILSTMEFTDNVVEASGRAEYLNNRAWKATYMVRKLSD